MLVSRRTLLQTATLAAAAPALGACSKREEPLPLPPDAPVGPFGKDATAEEVTAGLDLTGQTILITGCNSGIGYETMRVLALRGAHVLGAARSMAKAEEACNSVQGMASPVVIELSDFDSVVAAANAVKAEYPTIDGVICNAGIMELPELEQVYGIERQFVVNHLGHFLLVNLLLEQLINAPQGRVTMVSSGSSTRLAPPEGIYLDRLSGEGWYTPGAAYGQSKLANVLFSLELAKRFQGSNATSNSLAPGVIPTNLGRHMPRWKTLALETVGKVFTKTIPQGAATSCYVATYPGLNEASGWFFRDCNPYRPGGNTENAELAQQLWIKSEEILLPWLTQGTPVAFNYAFGGLGLR
jgi:NAD(P)-dependent dehydrogenase (short-subunit alcohol dehydrogenase family)